MPDAQRFPYVEIDPSLGSASALPYVPLTLEHRGNAASAWTRNNEVPVILGQVNFFMEYDVCFFRSRSAFEIRPKGSNAS